MADISFREAQQLIDFNLISGNNVARRNGWGYSLFHHERKKESEEHKLLREISARHFRKKGYKLNMMPVGVKGIYTISDYFAVKDNTFFFVECLTKQTIKNHPDIFQKKLQLSKYAPLWFIVPNNVDINESKLGNAKILFVDFEKEKVENINS